MLSIFVLLTVGSCMTWWWWRLSIEGKQRGRGKKREREREMGRKLPKLEVRRGHLLVAFYIDYNRSFDTRTTTTLDNR